MKVLVACEFSATVRDAFRSGGHDAWSCDLLPCEGDQRWHIQGDVLPILVADWDLMVAHPPCTYLANSGVRWLYGGKGTERDSARWALMEEGAAFFDALLSAPIPRIAVENPVMHGHARARILTQPDTIQTIQPWMFGHGEVKATQLWLKGLPRLTPTDVVQGREARVHRMAPSPDRWRERSRFFAGIASAMADQWG